MQFLTDFADQAVVLPLVLALGLMLAVQGWWFGAIVWLSTISATFAAVLALKLIFLGCAQAFGPDFAMWHLQSPSGHAAAATMLAGGIVCLITARAPLAIAGGLAIGTIIGITRLALQVHSVAEVALGVVVGLIGVASLARMIGQPPKLRLVPMAAVVVAIVGLFHGLHLPAETAIRDGALQAGIIAPFCRLDDPQTRP